MLTNKTAPYTQKYSQYDSDYACGSCGTALSNIDSEVPQLPQTQTPMFVFVVIACCSLYKKWQETNQILQTIMKTFP